MRILTGRDRTRYEEMVKEAVRFYEQAQAKEALAKFLAEEKQKLETLLGYEKARADRAVDELLSIRGVPPVSPPPTEPTFQDGLEEDPELVRELEQRIAAGDVSVWGEGR